GGGRFGGGLPGPGGGQPAAPVLCVGFSRSPPRGDYAGPGGPKARARAAQDGGGAGKAGGRTGGPGRGGRGRRRRGGGSVVVVLLAAGRPPGAFCLIDVSVPAALSLSCHPQVRSGSQPGLATDSHH